ncbi:uncharacterized protein [Aegilops tauschii subsp. strangulata]|uniref:uncharacterized protein n=1 Tax=Aegilops tauschii subsp. strangulata TaxID=200361 RepID=UPI00098A30D5|nr:uncharacterized protein LOC109736575 [Aegilops tauschii subsp. strangulata]
MHFDGSKMRLGLGAGIVLSSPKGDPLKYALQIHFTASNNVAEYEALVHGLRLAKELGIWRILCYGDSDLVVQQCSGEWDARDPNMASYRFLVQKLSGFFAGCEFLHVPRAENEASDTLAKIASSRQSIPSGVSLEHLHKPSVKPSPDSESIYVPDDPAAPQPGPGTTQPGPGAAAVDPAAAVLKPGAAEPVSGAAAPEPAMHGGRLCRGDGAIVGPAHLRVSGERGPPHGRDRRPCGHHAASRSLVAKAFRHGFYWTTALEDAESLVLKCEGCQRFSKRIHQPALALRTIAITWPFAVWGLDMAGPFRTARGGMTHLLVAVDKFTKWIEARPIKKLDGPTAVRFVKDIAIRYGMPNSIITDSGTNFAKGAHAQYCSVSGIRLDLASVAHPQSNSQVERANGLMA